MERSVPDLRTRKIATAEILAARGFALRPLSPISDEDAERLGQLRAYVSLASRTVDTLSDNSALADHLDVVLRKLEQIVGPIPPKSAAAHCINSISKQFALSPNETDGEWGVIDHLVLSAMQQTVRHYSVLRGMDVSIDISTVIRGTSKESMSVSTEFPAGDAASGRKATINIYIPDSFAADDYFRLFGMLHHEFFVHVMQDLSSAGRRRYVGDKCYLAEGLVDRAAHLSLLDALSRNLVPGIPLALASRFIDRLEAAHAQRFQEPKSTGSNWRIYEARKTGRDAFARMVVARRIGDGEGWSSEVAMRLNTASLDPDERRRIVFAIHDGLNSWTPVGPAVLMSRLDAIVSGSADADETIKSIIHSNAL